MPRDVEQPSTLTALLDEITSHLFLSAVPGVAEQEVWGWLQRVAQEFETLRARNRNLVARVNELEQQLNERRRLTDEQLLAELPGRTARALRSAQEVGDEIVQRASERAELIAREAAEQAAEVRKGAEADARTILREAELDAEAQVEAARSAGKDIVVQARALRERILADLAARQAAFEDEIERLQMGRDQLLDAYFAVKRTFDEATSTFSREEPSAADTVAPNSPRRRWARGRAPQDRRSHEAETPLLEPGNGRPASGPPASEQPPPGGQASRYTVRPNPRGTQSATTTSDNRPRSLRP
ncbi:MAG: DivIVA domain-containing protein [Actinomycetota bacterium]|nr:DivIVA domain-containing protein [Actinomycetota bacterium]